MTHRERNSVPGIVLAVVCLGQAPAAVAEGTGAAAETTSATEAAPSPVPSKVFDHLLVTGGAERVAEVPGSATFIGPAELERQGHSDLHRILEEVPGVNLQDEEGYGLRPNIGMRGTGVERSQKITLLEDGVPIAPAPYSAPAAYYSPTPGRMASVEVRKGSSSIRQGPHTIGGVINLISSDPPERLGGRAEVAAGEDATRRLHASAGDSRDRYGWLAETYRFETDGFKRLDGGGSTGVELEDYLGKARVNTRADAAVYQQLELKLGRTDQLGDETYLGLTRADFAATPLRRYAASAADTFDSQHEQLQLRWFVQPGPRVHLTATLYRNDFFRNWQKLQSVAGRGLAAVLDAPGRYPRELGLLRGELDSVDGPLVSRNNRRDYLSEGVELSAVWHRSSRGRVDHRLEAGVRLHRDEEDRFQEEDRWNMLGGRLLFDAFGAPGSQSNRIDSAEALAAFVRDEIVVGRWRISPGLRIESVQFERLDFGRADPLRLGTVASTRRNDVTELIPGLGVGFRASERWSLFGGVHRGFGPPGPGQSDATEAEASWNWEAGFALRRRRSGARVVAFFNDYDNLLGRDTLSSSGEGTGDAFNGGAVEVRGLEATFEIDLGRAAGFEAAMPLRLGYTFTEAEFQTSFETRFADWAPAVEAGDELPYIPEQRLTASLGWIRGRWEGYLSVSHAEAMRSKAGRGPIPAETRIDPRTVADLSASYHPADRWRLFVQVRNLTDATYLAARRPAGARPGLPRTLLFGLSWGR